MVSYRCLVIHVHSCRCASCTWFVNQQIYAVCDIVLALLTHIDTHLQTKRGNILVNPGAKDGRTHLCVDQNLRILRFTFPHEQNTAVWRLIDPILVLRNFDSLLHGILDPTHIVSMTSCSIFTRANTQQWLPHRHASR